eukprot:m.443477 g.443477  ORF g.443477 m.443477 type:complete len:386 (-) comp18971_c0_seq1:2056-3213(-)
MEEYRPCRILITGGAGFIGASFTQLIAENYPEYTLVVLDRLAYCANMRSLEPHISSGRVKFVKGDVTNADMVNYVMLTERIDTVVHFAAETHVDNSFGSSLEFTRSNILGTHVLLEAARAHMPVLRRFIHVSTDEVYGENKGETFLEKTSTLDPTNPYSATKASAEMLVKAYQQSYSVPIIISRGNNVYGPRQYPEKVVPKFIHRAMRGMSMCIHGPGEQQRSYLHVDDVAAAFDTILHRGVTGEVYNIGTDAEISISLLANEVCKAFGLDPTTHIEHVEDRRINDQRYKMDASKLSSLGWAPKVHWDKGFAETVRWYKENADYWPEIDDALSAHPKKHPGPATWTCTILPSGRPPSETPFALILMSVAIGALIGLTFTTRHKGA